jgi:Smg protein
MFEILLYLYDHYLLAEQFPDAEQLTRKLSAAGFEDQDIADAVNWLSALDDLNVEEESTPSMRVFHPSEESRLAPEGRGFLAWLESAALLPPHGREWVIGRALALPDAEVSASQIKWIALLALWKLRGVGDVLWLEDLVRGDDELGDEPWQPTLH